MEKYFKVSVNGLDPARLRLRDIALSTTVTDEELDAISDLSIGEDFQLDGEHGSMKIERVS